MRKIMKNKNWIPCYRDTKKNDFVLKLRTLEDLKEPINIQKKNDQQ